MNVKFDFSGKNFVVVGASSGIGKQVTIELADSSANVLAIARNEDRLAKLKENNPAQILTASLDVTSAAVDDWIALLDDFKDKFGKIDGGVYCAGVIASTPINSFDNELAHKIFDTNFWGAIDFIQIAAKKKYSNANSSFVMISSISARCGGKGIFAYTASKAAVQSMIKSVAREIIRNGHRINSVAPAVIKTDMSEKYSAVVDREIYSKHLLGVGEPSDVSGMILFLLSDRAGWITGQNFLLDGGYLLGSII